MNSYNFDNIDFDVDLGSLDKNGHEKMMMEAKKL